MRFRPKFGLQGWSWVALGCLSTLLLARAHSNRLLWSVWPILALQFIFGKVFIYWEVDASGLHERRFWRRKEIAWDEITHVGSWIPSQPGSDYVAVDYGRPAPMSDRGSVIANPADRAEFIAALRRFAPQADFEV